MKLRDLSIAQGLAIVLGIVGLGIGAVALFTSNPFLGLFAITVVCSGGVSALVGLQQDT